jgi:type IV secretory pathway TraG/TraD family ATPase VirD4
MGVRQSLAALGDPNVLAAVTPGATEQFDPEAFITGCGTLYLVGTSTGAGAAANLVSALVEDILDVARHLAAASPGARLDPPITVMLNEIGNLAPLPSLPTLMSEGGGTGICTWAILQSLAQARHRWGEQAAATVWDACTTKIVLGGGANATDLRDLSALIGDRDETTWAETRGGDGTRSRSSSLRRVPVLDPGRLRTLPFGSAVLLLRSVPPAVVKLHRWSDRQDKADASPRGRSPTVTAHPLIGRNSGLELPVGTGGSTVGGPPLTQGRCSA